MLHQGDADGSVIARSRAMQWCPRMQREARRRPTQERSAFCSRGSARGAPPPHRPQVLQRLQSPLPVRAGGSPAMAVGRIDIGPDIDQEVHDAVVGPTDGVVQGGDPLVVRLARVIQLQQEKAEGRPRLSTLWNGRAISRGRCPWKPSPAPPSLPVSLSPLLFQLTALHFRAMGEPRFLSLSYPIKLLHS